MIVKTWVPVTDFDSIDYVPNTQAIVYKDTGKIVSAEQIQAFLNYKCCPLPSVCAKLTSAEETYKLAILSYVKKNWYFCGNGLEIQIFPYSEWATVLEQLERVL